MPAFEVDVLDELVEVDLLGDALVDVEGDASSARAFLSVCDRAEVFDDTIVVGGERSECCEDLLKVL